MRGRSPDRPRDVSRIGRISRSDCGVCPEHGDHQCRTKNDPGESVHDTATSSRRRSPPGWWPGADGPSDVEFVGRGPCCATVAVAGGQAGVARHWADPGQSVSYFVGQLRAIGLVSVIGVALISTFVAMIGWWLVLLGEGVIGNSTDPPVGFFGVALFGVGAAVLCGGSHQRQTSMASTWSIWGPDHRHSRRCVRNRIGHRYRRVDWVLVRCQRDTIRPSTTGWSRRHRSGRRLDRTPSRGPCWCGRQLRVCSDRGLRGGSAMSTTGPLMNLLLDSPMRGLRMEQRLMRFSIAW